MSYVDVLIATYNGEKYIGDLISSINSQTYDKVNIIICDDCSTDNTIEVIENYIQTQDNISLYINENNLGYIKNFEKLIGLSENEYFMLCDQDDIWLRDKISQSIEILENSDKDLVFTDLSVVDERLELISESFNRSMRLNPNRIKSNINLFTKNYATGCTMLVRARLKDELLPFIHLENPLFIHDWYILLVAAVIGRGFEYLDVPTVLYRQHEENNIGFKTKKKFTLSQKYKEAVISRQVFLSQHISFFRGLNERFGEEFHDYYVYIQHASKAKWINLRLTGFGKYFQAETFKDKVIYFLYLHFPMLFFNKKS